MTWRLTYRAALLLALLPLFAGTDAIAEDSQIVTITVTVEKWLDLSVTENAFTFTIDSTQTVSSFNNLFSPLIPPTATVAITANTPYEVKVVPQETFQSGSTIYGKAEHSDQNNPGLGYILHLYPTGSFQSSTQPYFSTISIVPNPGEAATVLVGATVRSDITTNGQTAPPGTYTGKIDLTATIP